MKAVMVSPLRQLHAFTSTPSSTLRGVPTLTTEVPGDLGFVYWIRTPCSFHVWEPVILSLKYLGLSISTSDGQQCTGGGDMRHGSTFTSFTTSGGGVGGGVSFLVTGASIEGGGVAILGGGFSSEQGQHGSYLLGPDSHLAGHGPHLRGHGSVLGGHGSHLKEHGSHLRGHGSLFREKHGSLFRKEHGSHLKGGLAEESKDELGSLIGVFVTSQQRKHLGGSVNLGDEGHLDGLNGDGGHLGAQSGDGGHLLVVKSGDGGHLPVAQSGDGGHLPVAQSGDGRHLGEHSGDDGRQDGELDLMMDDRLYLSGMKRQGPQDDRGLLVLQRNRVQAVQGGFSGQSARFPSPESDGGFSIDPFGVLVSGAKRDVVEFF